MEIEFLALDKRTLELVTDEFPYSARKKLPQWFLDIPKFLPDDCKVDRRGDPNTTIRSCMPFLDYLTAGYHIPLPCDVWVHRDGPNTSVRWAQDQLNLFVPHDARRSANIPTSNDFEPVLFKIVNPWIIRTPKGYSCIIQHPYGHDLPFNSLGSLTDTDKHPMGINIPIQFKVGFEGLIPKGTPFIQVIPFKREEWSSSVNVADKRLETAWEKAHSYFFDRYRRFFRSKKIYKCPFSGK
jgi:hypothetical protein